MSKRLGDCYNKHGNMMMDKFHSGKSKGWKIVHGLPMGQGPIKGIRFGHCWLEKDSVVYDYSNGGKRIIPKALYYRMGKIKKTNKYTAKEFMKKVVEKKTWGPQSSYSINW